VSRMLEVLELFAEASGLVDRGVSHHPQAGGLEGYRVAWRERQVERGECRSCRRPSLEGRRYCAVHRARNIARALAAKARRAA
jgi:hypothetical protein